jgi:uncharacterized protein YebE (UPF0316 family)
MELFEPHSWLLAAAIFLARVVDVSLGTVRTILVVRGHRFLAAAIGFFEILIWVVAVSEVIRNLESWHLAIAYAAGFAVGNVVGIWLEGKLAIGSELVRAISASPEANLAQHLRKNTFEVLELDGHGDDETPVEVLLIVERRRRVPRLLRLIRETDPDAVCTVSDVKSQTAPPSPGFRARKLAQAPRTK